MQIKTKLSLAVGLVVILSYGLTFYRTSAFQKELVFTQVVKQARMLHKQVLMTRKWVSDHNGLFVLKTSHSPANPFLKAPDAEIHDDQGHAYVKRNPAMVTRELSDYSQKEGLFRYRVTTLKPINPANSPDDFERQSLLKFEKGQSEVSEIVELADGKALRYISPLYVEESCLECHAQQGYKVGDIRGALSTTIPVDWAYTDINSNNRMLLGICIATIIVVCVAIFWVMNVVVVRRLGHLSQAIEAFPERQEFEDLPEGDDEVGRLTGKFQELTKRLKKSQEELDQTRAQIYRSEKLAALGRLAAGVAHEINNPLGGMMNCVKSMRENPGDSDMAGRYLGLVEKGLKRVGEIVSQLLKFGRREPVQYSKVVIDEIVSECFLLLEYGLKHIDLQLDLHLPEASYVDGEGLRQVVVNLGLNAVQAMPDGGQLSVRTFAENNRHVLEFEDTGSGIAPEHMEKIFDPFFSTKEVGQGSGLGLSITYSLVERMHGTIIVTSKLGKGTCFRIEIPDQAKGEE